MSFKHILKWLFLIILMMSSSMRLSASISESTEGPLVLEITSYGPYCNGGTGTATVSVSGGQAPYFFLWNTPVPQNTQTATGLIGGQTYTVTVTDAANTTATATVTMDDPQPFLVEVVATDPTCNGLNDGTIAATVTGGTPPLTYLWSDGQTNPTAINLLAGTYSLSVTDVNGCQVSAQATLTNPDALDGGSISTTGQTILVGCNADLIMSVGEGSSGGGAVSYQWKANGEVVAGVTATSYTPGAEFTGTAGVYHFTREVNDECNAGWLASAGVWTLTVLDIVINGAPSYCESLGSTTLSGPAGLDAYEWYLNGTLIDGQVDQTLVVTESGNYSLKGTLHGCSKTSIAFPVEEIQAYYPSEIGGSCSSSFYWAENHHTYLAQDYGYNVMFSDSAFYSGVHCDSVVYFQWTFWQYFEDTLYATDVDRVCQNSEYFVNGVAAPTQDVGGPFYQLFFQGQTFHNACDSVIWQEYFVLPNYDSAVVIQHESVCQNEPFVWEIAGHTVTMTTSESGVTDTTILLTSAFGCDSIAALELTVYPNVTDTIPFGACDSAVYHYYGQILVFHEDGVYPIDTLSTPHGCDSIIFVDVSIIGSAQTDTVVDESCEFYVWEQDTLISTGYYDYHYAGFSGCDSTITLDLTIHHESSSSESYTVCQDEEFFWNNNVQYPTEEAGVFYDTIFLQSQVQPFCDSISILELTVLPKSESTVTAVACVSYTWMGNTYFESTIDSVIIPNHFGCDSLIWLNLTLWDVYDSTFYVGSVCVGDTIQYPYNNDTVTAIAPPMTDTLRVALHYYAFGSPGCDSLVTYLWNIHQPFDTAFQVEECNLFEINGVICERDTILNFMYQTDHHCDSSETYFITIHHDEIVEVEDHICHGSYYSNYGFDINTDELEGGFVYDYGHEGLTTVFGCDSSFYLTLHVEESYDSIIADPAESCGRYVWMDEVYTESGIYSQVWQTLPYGCDSIVYKEINIYPEYDLYFEDQACQYQYYANDSLRIYVGFDTTNVLGTYQITRELSTNSMMHCDSTIHLTLEVIPSYDILLYDTTCLYTPYDDNNFLANADTVGNYEIDSIWPTVLRCDSTVRLMLTVLPSYNDTIREYTCREEVFEGFNFHIGHQFVDSVGTHFFTDSLQLLSSPFGCDSIVTLELQVHDIFYTKMEVDTCISFRWDWDWGQHQEIFNEDGIYSRTWHSMQSNYRCDSVVALHLTLRHMPSIGEIRGSSSAIVASDNYNGIFDYYVDSVPNCLGYEWSLSNANWVLDTVGNTPYCSVTVTTEETAILTARALNDCGFSESYINIRGIFTGLDESLTSPTIRIRPNPSDGDVMISLGGVHDKTLIKVYDASGNQLDAFEVNLSDNTEIRYSLNGFSSGLYLFVVNANGRIALEKVIKN